MFELPPESNEGATASLSVMADGPAPLTYEWLRNGTAIAGATGASCTTPATTAADMPRFMHLS